MDKKERKLLDRIIAVAEARQQLFAEIDSGRLSPSEMKRRIMAFGRKWGVEGGINTGIEHMSFNGLAGTSMILFTAVQNSWKLVMAPLMRFSAAGGASFAATLVVCASGTAVASGTSMLSSTIALTGSADTNVQGTLSGTPLNLIIPKGSSLGIKFSGTLGSFANGVVTFGLIRLTGTV